MTLGTWHWSGFREALRTSFWLTPVLVTLTCGAAAIGLVQLDHALSSEFTTWYVYGGHADGARELLSTIASSMLTIGGLVFSITILVLQLASSQFTPRVLRTFLEDDVTQWTMGMFLGSFVYALVLLPQVRSEDDSGGGFVPGVAVFVAFALSLVSVGVFVRYIHHMAHSIRATSVIARVAAETHQTILRLYPERVLQAAPPDVLPPLNAPTRTVQSGDHAGVIIDVDTELLMELATERNLVIALLFRVGDFIPRHAPLLHVWGAAGDDDLRYTRCIALAQERTPRKDAAFGFRQLVDLAVRALSPGVNDPTTAVQVLDHLHDLLRSLAQREIPSPARTDKEGHLRLYLPRPDWPDYVQLALEEIRLYGAGSVHVVRRTRVALRDLLSIANAERAAVLERELSLLERAAARELPSDVALGR